MGKDKKNKGNSELNTPMAVNNALAGADLDSKPKANDKNKKNTPKKNGKNAPNKERVGFFKKLKNTFKKLKNTFKELKNVKWPDGKTVVTSTFIVLVVVFIFFVGLMGIDSALLALFNLLVNKG